MKKLKKSLLILCLTALGLFLGSIVVYLGNLDMKLIAWVQPRLEPIYDRIERRPMP